MFGLSVWDGFLSGLRFCFHQKVMFRVRLGSDIGVVIHRVDDNVFFDVVFLFHVGKFVYPYRLYGELYRIGF